MRIEKLFRVLVVGGSALTAGCGDGGGAPAAVSLTAASDASAEVAVARSELPDVAIGSADASPRADGVSSWMSWFVDPEPEDAAAPNDAASDDTGPVADATNDSGADAGVLAWLSWV